MERAKRLLESPGMKISVVARQVGYINYHYFSGIFKRYTGLTPSEFRSMQ
jgi:two-component system response regulator YesN